MQAMINNKMYRHLHPNNIQNHNLNMKMMNYIPDNQIMQYHIKHIHYCPISKIHPYNAHTLLMNYNKNNPIMHKNIKHIN